MQVANLETKLAHEEEAIGIAQIRTHEAWGTPNEKRAEVSGEMTNRWC